MQSHILNSLFIMQPSILGIASQVTYAAHLHYVIIIIIIIILLKQDYKIQLTNNKILMAWLTS